MSRSRRPSASLDLATFFDVSLDLLCIRDQDYRFLKVNQAWETALGWRVEELIGRPMIDFVHPDDVEASRERMRLVAVQNVMGFVNRYRHRDGSYRNLEWRARHVGDLVFGVARDVTERLALEAEMAAARAAAEAANQAKSDFLANMSHEIRTPLNGVIGIAGALRRTPLTPDQQEMVSLIEGSGVSLERLVSDVLDFSKIEAGRLEIETRVFDLRPELDGLLEMHRLRAADKGLAFPVTWGPQARGAFVGDSVRLKQVVANLLSNAVKFTEAGSVAVWIDVVEPAAPDAPPSLQVEIQDTGVGFDDASAAKLFQRFSQADATITRRFGGTGLGLSITRGIVELMDGAIHAVSRPGEGSLFRVAIPLPRARPLAAVALEAPEVVDLGRLAGLRVLLAEDHAVNQRVITLILGPLGVEVTIVEDGAKAVEAFQAGDYDLVLMDMQMPVMDGLAATRALRGHETRSPARPRTPIVMLSANAMAQHRAEAQASGADLHLAKPITPAALIAGVLEAIDLPAAAVAPGSAARGA
jgi:PAS domain S-box-containing protein